MYALNLNEENRILSACIVLPNGDYTNMPIVDILPEGNIADYLYIDGEYIHSPLPQPEEPEHAPTEMELLWQAVTDNEIAILELASEVLNNE